MMSVWIVTLVMECGSSLKEVESLLKDKRKVPYKSYARGRFMLPMTTQI